MSEAETKIEIEDVLASIRRLVSRDAGAVRTQGLPHRAAAAPVPVQEGECLVLTPAQRVAETEAEPVPEHEGFAEMPAAEIAPDAEAVPEEALVAEAVAEADFTAVDWAEGEAEAADAVALAVVEAAAAPVADVPPAEDADWPGAEVTDEFMPEGEVMAAPRPPTEAEALLAEAEAALAETGAGLEDATTAFASTGEAGLGPDTDSAAGSRSVDLGDELARLESTIAELEAAVAESGADFEPERGYPFEAEAETALTEWPEAAEPTAEPAPADTTAAFDADLTETDLPEPASTEPESNEPDTTDPDLAEASWAEPAQVGMDWAEATLRLAERGPRRLTRDDADFAMLQPEAVQSTYAALREELTQEDEPEAAALPDGSEPLFDDATIDEATLREIVGQMVRAELRGALGERITQNVRKLVRREIQRALMGQDFD